MTISELEPLCLQDAMVNSSNWSLAGHKKKRISSALPWVFFLYEHSDECYFICLDFPLLFTVWVVETSSVKKRKEM